MGKSHTLRRYLVLILVATLVLTSGIVVGCAPDLPKEENDAIFTCGYEDGYSWGYWLTAEDSHRKDLFWTPPDKVDDAQKFNPKVNIRDFYIPKGYLTMGDVANLHFPDGTPFNDKQKEQWAEAYNWGFYSGFKQGCDDCIKGKLSHTELLNPFPENTSLSFEGEDAEGELKRGGASLNIYFPLSFEGEGD